MSQGVTPPTFDPQPIKERTLPAGLAEYRQPYAGYNEVLDRYSEWLLAQREKVNERLQKIIDAGFTFPVVGMQGDDVLEQFEMFARDVMPVLRRQSANA